MTKRTKPGALKRASLRKRTKPGAEESTTKKENKTRC